MQIRRRYTAAMAVFGAFISVAALQPNAAPATTQAEDSLLGVRLLDSYKTVLKRFGQPAEIQVGVSIEPEGDAGTGGGMPGSGGPMGMPGSGGPMGMPGSGGPMGMPGSGGPSLPGFGGPGGGRPMGMPGSGGPMGMPGGASTAAPGTGSMPIIPGTGGGTSEETIWWYKYPQQGVFLAFMLNKQGQVIQIQSHGYKTYSNTPNARTAKGVTLGASLGSVLKNYGWSNNGEHSGEYVVMRYDSRERIRNGHGRLAFQVLKNQVVGITIGFVK